MKFPFIKHPKTGIPDEMVTMIVIATAAATIRFFFDGVDMTVAGHHVGFSKLDPLAYGAFLTPILGAHGYLSGKDKSKPKVDNPDDQS